MTYGNTRSASQRIAISAAISIIAVSAACNASFGWQLGSSTHVIFGAVLVLGSVAGDIIKPYAAACVIDAGRSFQFGRMAIAVIVATVCIIYSLCASLGLASLTRSDMTAQRGADVGSYARAKARHDTAAADLLKLGRARPVREVEAALERPSVPMRVWRRTNGCRDVTRESSRTACQSVSDLKRELARANARLKLQETMRTAEAEMARKSAVTDADPQAAAIAAYIALLGYTLKPEAVAPWLALVAVAFIEISSAFALVVVRGQEEKDAPTATPLIVPEASQRPRPKRSGGNGETRSSGGTCSGTGGTDAALDQLRRISRDGRYEGSMSRLGEALGVSKSEAHRLAHELADSGAVRLQTGARGSVLELATDWPGRQSIQAKNVQ